MRETHDALERLHERICDEHEFAEALRRQSAQASRRAAELLANAAELTAAAERMVADARAIRGEHATLRADG